MIRKFRLAVFAALATIIISSCTTSESVNYIEISCNMANRTVSSNGSTTISGSTYLLVLDFNSSLATLSTSSASIPGISASTFVIYNIPFTYDSYGYYFDIDYANPTINGVIDSSITFSNINGYYTSNEYQFSYTVDELYTTYVTPLDIYYGYSETTVTNTYDSTAESFVSEDIAYEIVFDTTNETADLYIWDAQFSESMTALDMVFKNLSLTPTATGYTINASSVTPEIDGTSYENYAATNMIIELKDSQFDISFNIFSGESFLITATADMNDTDE